MSDRHATRGRDPETGGPSRPLFRIAQRVFLASAWLTRGMTLGVRGIARDAGGRVFLVRHSYVPGWHLPGGGVDAGETLEQALVRELREEGHLELPGRPILRGVFLNRQASRCDHVAVFVAEGAFQTSPRPPDREIVESGFFETERLPDATTAATLRRLAELANDIPAGSEW
ncbi:MAG: NUDIX domain-containing protein [Beijerinckiaceae bacterium]